MVDHRHADAGEQQVPVLHLLRPVGVHHHQQGVAVGLRHGLLGADEGVPVLRGLADRLDQALRGVMMHVDDDVGLHAELPCKAADAHRCAHTVQVGKAVTHHQHPGGILHQLRQGVGHNPGLDLGAFFHLIAPAAVELKAHAVFDDGLVAAPAQGQFRGHIRKLQHLAEVLPVDAQADADGSADACGAFHLVDLIGDFELLLPQPLHILPLHQHEITVPVIAAQDAVEAVAPFFQLVLHRVPDVVFHPVGLVADHFLQVVNDDDAGHRPCVLIFLADLVIVGDVHPIGDAHKSVLLITLVGADDVAVKLVLAPAQLQQGGILGLALQQPLAGKLGHHLGDAGIHAGAVLAAHGKEHVVAPHDHRIRQPENGDGQREIHQCVVFGVLRLIGYGLDIGGQLLLLPALGKDGDHHQQQNNARLNGRQLIQPEKQRSHGKSHQDEHMDGSARLRQPPQILIHGVHPFHHTHGILHYNKLAIVLQYKKCQQMWVPG